MVSLTSCVVGGGDASVSRMVPPSIVRGGGGARWATWPWVLSLGCLLTWLVVGGGWALLKPDPARPLELFPSHTITW